MGLALGSLRRFMVHNSIQPFHLTIKLPFNLWHPSIRGACIEKESADATPPPVFHFGIGFGGRSDLGLGSRADRRRSKALAKSFSILFKLLKCVGRTDPSPFCPLAVLNELY